MRGWSRLPTTWVADHTKKNRGVIAEASARHPETASNWPPNANQETQHLAQHPEYRWVPPIATESDSLRNGLEEANAQKVLNCARESDALREGASDFESTPRRTRTFDPLIKSQLLYQLS
jgi:hypothetical protein